jgi:hypothetical protein
MRLRYELHFSQVTLLIPGFDEIEQVIKEINRAKGNVDNIEGVSIVFEYGIHELPKRE